MACKIDEKKCLKCGICVGGCPEGARFVDDQVTEPDGLVLYMTRIN